MQDRFKFRATVKGYYYIDTPEKCEEFKPLIFLENIDVLDIGDIGIPEEDLEIAIRKQYPDLQDVYIECILGNFMDNSTGIDTYITITPERVYQCTGLKDRKGKLIYEGDVVKINENYCDYSAIEDFYKNQNFIVEYFQPRAVYLLKPFEYKSNDGSGIHDLSPDFYEFLKWKPCGKLEEYTLQGIEVIGNIYENKELLNDSN